ncbi:flagellar protein FlaG [Bacillus altitudinis]|uniref:flagellar protein FlaG n=1 Tax=Bacillus TaxID=1386 RepID=UPI00064C7BA9|nr:MULTISPECIES: flagellar protein FlaG [Bacillus]KLV23953.1 flagellar protein FlaG [Bacillus altitudinis]MDH6598654.1 flagellar protein FlaG [Bacillus aerius]QCU20534.1 flagellar protein FlaG [Bacillus altitudinis]
MSVGKLTSLEPLIDAFQTRVTNHQNDNANTDLQANGKVVSKEEIEKTLQGANKLIEPTQFHLQFELHEKLNEYYVKVVDNQTEEVIREIPSKEWLDFYAAMTEIVGLFVDKRT